MHVESRVKIKKEAQEIFDPFLANQGLTIKEILEDSFIVEAILTNPAGEEIKIKRIVPKEAVELC